MFDVVTKCSCGQAAGSIHTPELAHSTRVLRHVQLSVADELVREIPAVSHPVTAGRDSDALVRVGAHELLGGACGLNLRGRQFAVELVAAVEAIFVPVAHLAPAQTARVVRTHEALALVDHSAEAALVSSIGTIEPVVAQLVQFHTRPISAHEFVSVTTRRSGNFLGLAEVGFVFSLSAVPYSVAHEAVVDAFAVVAHELVPVASGCFGAGSFGWAERSFVLTVSAVFVAIANFLFGNARPICTREFTKKAIGFRLRWRRNRLTEVTLVVT